MSFHKQLSKHKQLRTLLILAFLVIGSASFVLKSVEGILAAFLLMNITSWLLIYLDKKKASRKEAFRIPEGSFMLISLFGGALGAWLGMYLHRHKTKHLRFTLGIPLLVIINIVLYGSIFKYM